MIWVTSNTAGSSKSQICQVGGILAGDLARTVDFSGVEVFMGLGSPPMGALSSSEMVQSDVYWKIWWKINWLEMSQHEF